MLTVGRWRVAVRFGEIIIKDTHRGLWYADGVLTRTLGAGRHQIPWFSGTNFFGIRRPKIEIELVDVRQRELTIKGQEILTSDKVAIRVSIIVQFRVVDPRAAIHRSTATKSGCTATCSWRPGGRWRRCRWNRS